MNKKVHFNHSLFLIIAGLLIAVAGYSQSNIGWQSGAQNADPVNVGSSKPAGIRFQFEVQDANIPGAKIEVQFPSHIADYYDPSIPAFHPGGGFIDYTGNINWNPSTRMLTFSGIDLYVGNNVSYNIPHFATDALPSTVTSNQVTITVRDGSDNVINNGTVTISYNYQRAQLLIENPVILPPDQSGLGLDFGTNTWSVQGNAYTAKTFKFGLRTANGSVDSLRLYVSLPKDVHEVTSGSWTANGIPVNRVTSTTDATNINYTLYIDQTYSIGGDGFDNGEIIDIGFDLNKKYCGDTEVNLSAAWGSSSDYVSSETHTGIFRATSAVGTPDLRRVGLGILQNSGNKLFMDGVTPNVIWVKVKNYSLTAPAADIVYTLSTSNTPHASFFEQNDPVRISRDGGSTWTVIPSTDIIWSGNKGNSGNTLIKPQYRVKRTRMQVNIDKIDANEEVIIEWRSYIAPDAFYNNPGNERNWYRSIRHDDNWSYTDLCRETTLSINSTNVYSKADILKGSNYGPMVKLRPGTPVEAKMISITTTALASSYSELNHSDSYYKIRIKLPKVVKITETASNPDVHLKRTSDGVVYNYASYTKNVLTGDSVEYVFDFKQKISTARDLYVKFDTDCSLPDGSYTADISIDYVPSSVAPYNVVMPKVAQFYCPVSVVCSPQGLTYDFEVNRTTVGLWDATNDKFPDNSNKITEGGYSQLASTDLQQVFSGDTLLYEFKGEVSGAGFNSLYAVLFSQVNQTVYQLIDYEIEGDNPPYTLTQDSRNTGNIAFGTGLAAPYNFMYGWKIKRSNGSVFNAGEKVTLKLRMKAIDNSYSYTPVPYKFTSWYYASPTDLSNMLNPGSNRNGFEEYTATSTYFKGNFSGWSTSKSSITFNGKHTEEGYAYLNPFYTDNYLSMTPFEFRHLATIDTIIVEIPDGYYVDDLMRFTMTNNVGVSNSTNFYVTAHPTSTRNRKVFCIRDMYAPNYGPASPPNTISMSDGEVSMTMYPKISSTPRTPAGTTVCRMLAVTDNHTYTQAYIPISGKPSATQFSTFNLVSVVSGQSLITSTSEATTKNINSRRMSWNLKIENAFSNTANDIWLYVQGPVENVSYQGVNGQGEGNRWIKLPTGLAGGGNFTDTLSFDIIPNAGCVNSKITVYPFYNDLEPGGWFPLNGTLTDAAFLSSYNQAGGDYDQYVYQELDLNINTVSSQISGNINPWSTSINDPSNLLSPLYGSDSVEVNVPFTVEISLDASGSAGPVAQLETQINFPKGLKYLPNSIYLEYNGTNYQVTDANWESVLSALTDAASVSPTSVTLKLKDILGQSNMSALFGAEGTIDGGKTAILRFQLIPTCEINMHAEQITAKIAGKRYCDLLSDATGSNIQTYPSGNLTLRNSLLPFRSDLVLTIDKNQLFSESVSDSANMTLSFRKLTKLAEPLQIMDSIRIEVPLSLSLDGGINYTYPAYGSLIPSAITGTIPTSNINDYVIDSIRYISWQLPISYYDNLYPTAESDRVTLNYNWKVKTGQGGLIYNDTTRVYGSVNAVQSPHFSGCSYQSSVADSVITPIVLIPGKIVTLPQGFGYTITDRYGNEITVTDTIIYSGAEFRFNVELLQTCSKSVPTVKANGVELVADGQGNYYFSYKFDVLVDTHITVDGVELNKYTVYFDTDGGSHIPPYTGISYGSTIPEPPEKPKHDSYDRFLGWYTRNDTAYIEPWLFNVTPVISDTTLYALWERSPLPIITRRVHLPEVDGVLTNPYPGSHYVKSGEDFIFSVSYSTAYPLKVMTGRVFEGVEEELTGTINENGWYEYLIRQVRSEIFVTIGPDPASGSTSANEVVNGTAVWTHNGKLYINLENKDTIYIYAISGQLIYTDKLPEGTSDISLNRGVYIVVLANGNMVKKVVVDR